MPMNYVHAYTYLVPTSIIFGGRQSIRMTVYFLCLLFTRHFITGFVLIGGMKSLVLLCSPILYSFLGDLWIYGQMTKVIRTNCCCRFTLVSNTSPKVSQNLKSRENDTLHCKKLHNLIRFPSLNKIFGPANHLCEHFNYYLFWIELCPVVLVVAGGSLRNSCRKYSISSLRKSILAFSINYGENTDYRHNNNTDSRNLLSKV